MKKIIVATTNINKVERIKNLLKKQNYEILSLKEMRLENIPEPEEKANTPVKIAVEKAMHYIDYVPEGTIILTQDDTIKLEGISEEDDPKLSIKGPVRKKYGEFTDELGAKYYTELAKKYGGSIPITFNYGHAIAIQKEKGRNTINIAGSSSKIQARLVDRIHKLETVPGYFLSAIIEVNKDGKWVPHNSLSEDELIKLDNDLYNSIMGLLENIK